MFATLHSSKPRLPARPINTRRACYIMGSWKAFIRKTSLSCCIVCKELKQRERSTMCEVVQTKRWHKKDYIEYRYYRKRWEHMANNNKWTNFGGMSTNNITYVITNHSARSNFGGTLWGGEPLQSKGTNEAPPKFRTCWLCWDLRVAQRREY